MLSGNERIPHSMHRTDIMRPGIARWHLLAQPADKPIHGPIMAFALAAFHLDHDLLAAEDLFATLDKGSEQIELGRCQINFDLAWSP